MSTEAQIAAFKANADWNLIPQHMRGGVERYVTHGVPMGDFGSAILSNDFMTAIGKADESNQAAIIGWARFIYNCIPAMAHGSHERVSAWMARGGLAGLAQAESEAA